MGEFYLQRKLFNRVKRAKTQGATISHPACSEAAKTNCSELADQPEERNHLSKSSNSMPQLNTVAMMMRQSSNESSSSSAGEISGSQANVSQSTPAAAAAAAAASISQTNDTRKIGRQARSKFISASRAISMLRRAASSLTSGGSNASGQLNAGRVNGETSGACRISVQRQNTGDSSQSQGSSSFLRPSSSTTNSSTCLNKELPHFIVPKMSALRLPLVCRIMSLDGELMREVFVHRYELGQYLIESLKVSVGIKDCKYFGFKLAKSFDDQEDLRNPWLDLNESVCKQLKNIKLSSQNSSTCSNDAAGTNQNNAAQHLQVSTPRQRCIDFYLRIKFYPPNLGRVQDNFLRHYLYLQLRRDLRLGKLTSSMNNLTLLMACVLQYEFGDCKPELIERVPELNILQNQDLIEEQAINVWQTRLVGLKRHQAQMQFLRAAVILETYGFDYYPVRDHQRQRAYLLGFNYAGIKTIRNGRIVHHFRWHSISKISYERRMIIFHIYPNENSKRKQILGFKCLSNEDCQNLYLRLLEQKYFFTVDLAYFDKSVRRPSCLYSSPSDNQLHCTPEMASSTDEPLPASTSFGALQAPLVGGGQAGVELELLDDAGGSSNERSDTSSLAQQACSVCFQQQQQQLQQQQQPPQQHLDGATNQPQAFPITANNHIIEPGFDRNYACRCGSSARDQTSQMDQTKFGLVHSGEAQFGGWLRPTESGRGGSLWSDQRRSNNELYCLAGNSNHLSDNQRVSCAIERATTRAVHLAKSIWTNVPSCAAIRAHQVSQRFTCFAEWALTQPATILRNHLRCFDEMFAVPENVAIPGQPQVSTRNHFPGVILSVLRFCIIIMMMNFLFRLADNCSSALIDLLTMHKPVSSQSSTREPPIGDESTQVDTGGTASFWSSMRN